MSKRKISTTGSKIRQEKFILEYIKTLNITKSAIAAGYSEKTAASQGSRLLKNVNVISRVRELQQEMLDQLPVSVFYVLQGYLDVYDRCMQKEPVLQWDYKEKALLETGEWQFDSKGAMAALDSMAKYLQMFVDRKDIKVEGGVADKLGELLVAIKTTDDEGVLGNE